MVLNGEYVHLGHFDEVLHYGCESEPMEIGARLATDDRDSSIRLSTLIRSGQALRSVSKTKNQAVPLVRHTVLSVESDAHTTQALS